MSGGRRRFSLWPALARWAGPGLDLPFAAFRWAFGLAVLLSYGQLVFGYDLYYSEHGMIPREEWLAVAPGYSIGYFSFIESDRVCRAIAAGGIIPIILFWWGIYPRIAALVSWYLLISLHDRCAIVLNGGDHVLRLMLFLFIFGRSDRRLSPIAPLVSSRPTDSFPIRLMQIQLALIYLGAGLAKLGGKTWVDGSALAFALRLESYSRADWSAVIGNPLIINFATYSTLIFELVFPLLVFPKKTRPYVLAFGVLLHLGIEAFMYIAMFSWVMIASYLCFAEPAWLERALARILRPFARFAQKRGVRATAPPGPLRGALEKLDIFRAVTWVEGGPTPASRSTWLRLATVVPSLIPWTVVLILPFGPSILTRLIPRSSGSPPADPAPEPARADLPPLPGRS